MGVLLGLLLTTLWAGAARAQSLSATVVTVSDFSPVTLSGFAQTTSATMSDFSVIDSRGTGEGWSVTVQATQFKEWSGSGYVTNGKSLPVGSLSMPAPTVSSAETSPAPSVTTGPYLIDGSSANIASAAVGTGQGTFSFVQGGPLTLTIPANAYATTYRSEVAVSIVSGP